MPRSIEVQGVTVDEAIQQALNSLGVGRDSVEIQIVHHPRGGFLGIGARRAKVRATLREQVMSDGEEFDMSPDERRRRGRRRRPRRRRGPGQDGAERSGDREPRSAASEAGGRRGADESRRGQQRQSAGKDGRSGGRDRRGNRDEREAARDNRRRGDSDESRRESKAETRSEGGRNRRGGRRRQGRERDEDGGRSRQAAERDKPAAPPAGAAEAPPQAPIPAAEVVAKAKRLVAELSEKMGFAAEVDAAIDDEAGEVVVTVKAEAEGLLIGRRGQTLDALEHLVNRMVSGAQQTAELRVALDIGGYRERRRESLVELAGRLRERALGDGRRVQVSPMSARDRKIFQDALEGDDRVETRVLGSGFYRRVLVAPVGLDAGSGPPAGESPVPVDAGDEREPKATGGADDADERADGDEGAAG